MLGDSDQVESELLSAAVAGRTEAGPVPDGDVITSVQGAKEQRWRLHIEVSHFKFEIAGEADPRSRLGAFSGDGYCFGSSSYGQLSGDLHIVRGAVFSEVINIRKYKSERRVPVGV